MKPTRERLLDAARELLRSGGASAVTMVAVARDADVSRQAAYQHFGDRSELLVALVDLIDRREGKLEAHFARVRGASSAAKSIRAWAEMQVARNPLIAPLARALDAERHLDTASSAAWRDRSQNRLLGAKEIIVRLAADKQLHPSWDHRHAAVMLAELTSFRVWDDLVNDAKIPAGTYVNMIVTAALSTLGAPMAKLAPRRSRRGALPSLT